MKFIKRRKPIKFGIYGIVALLLVTAALTPACAPPPSTIDITIGALLPLTGELSSGGEDAQAGLEIAADDINDYLAEVNSKARVTLVIEDTQTSPVVALDKLDSLAQNGIKLVIGPDSSAEIQAVKAYADENEILVLSHASTAASLAIPGDNVFRFVPDDTLLAEALAVLMWDDGIRAIIPIWRGDVWGEDLLKATKEKFEKLGGNVIDGISYDPTAGSFGTELETLDSKLGEAIDEYGTGAVAVYLLSYEEALQILAQAQDYANLPQVKWYGGGSQSNSAIVSDTQAAQFAAATNFLNPMYSDKGNPVKRQIEDKIKRTPEPFALVAYDAVWVATKAYLAAGTHETSVLKKALVHEAEQYYGATGWTVLNEAGDRKFGEYDFCVVVEDNGTFQWKRIARYESVPDMPRSIIR
ncbi:MAG: penicillin-binding protein activator [Dehalococcoidia bacterium]|nr:penicillin-binding protein activator [Dehalococcoidia bacterium]